MLQTGACYIRVSTEDQREYSPDAQLRLLNDYAVKNNIVLNKEHIYIDAGISGRKADKRPAFMKMIAVAKTKPKPFDVILVHKFDRFARSREDSVVYKSLLKKESGIRVVSITESIEEDKFSVILEAMLEAMAEYYSINLAEEVKKGMTEKARQGGYQTTPPLGYQIEGKGLVILEAEAQYIRYIFDQYVNHDKSSYQIAKRLNEMGAKSKRGNLMDLRGVEYILQNPTYIGMVRWTPSEKAGRNFSHPDTIIVKGSHEPIISEEEFNKAALKFKAVSRKLNPKARRISECKHWLSGLIKCSNCGSSLSVALSLRYPSFQCTAYSKGRCPCSHSITVKKLEGAILNELKAALQGLDSTGFIPKAVHSNSNAEEIKLLKKQLSKIEDKLKRVNAAYLDEIYSLDEFREHKSQLILQREKINKGINKLQDKLHSSEDRQLTSKLFSLTDLLREDISMDIKQKAVRSIIEKIIYDKPNGALDVYFYDV